MEDYYELIDVDSGASLDDIKKVCYELLLKYHPDKTTHDSEQNANFYLKLQEARKVLLDADSRRDYDKNLKEYRLNKLRPVFSYVGIDELEYEEEEELYYMECRCGGEFSFTTNVLKNEKTIHVPCTDCTYDIVVTLD